jgi:hypothetical protein
MAAQHTCYTGKLTGIWLCYAVLYRYSQAFEHSVDSCGIGMYSPGVENWQKYSQLAFCNSHIGKHCKIWKLSHFCADICQRKNYLLQRNHEKWFTYGSSLANWTNLSIFKKIYNCCILNRVCYGFQDVLRPMQPSIGKSSPPMCPYMLCHTNWALYIWQNTGHQKAQRIQTATFFSLNLAAWLSFKRKLVHSPGSMTEFL